MIRHSLFALHTALLWLVFVSAGLAQSSLFDGRTLTYVVGSKPGGGYDLYARTIAPYLQKNLPGSTVVVRNEPSGRGVGVLRRMARQTGPVREISSLNASFVFSQLVGNSQFEGDLTEFHFLGKASSEARFLLVKAGHGLSDLDAVRDRDAPLVCLVSASNDSGSELLRRLLEGFEIPARIVPGFRGSERLAALAKGEADCTLSSESNVTAPLESGFVEVLGYVGEPTNPDLVEQPDFADLAMSEPQYAAVAFVRDFAELGRLTLTGPGTPPEETVELRAAYAAALSDPAFLSQAAALNMPVKLLGGQEVQEIIERMLTSSAASN